MRRLLIILALALPALPGLAEPADPLPPQPEVHEVLLPNGMRFLLVRRPEAPIFFGVITFKVGAVDDPKNASGLAHLFEHMAFKGTRAIGTLDWDKEKPLLDRIEQVGEEATALETSGKDPARLKTLRAELESLHRQQKLLLAESEFWQTYVEAGGTGINASTSADWTNYFVSLPSNRLELWMLMESERFRDPVLREFYSERDVVPEERRMRIDTNPGGLLWEQFLASAFLAHPYHVPVIGWMPDIQRLTMADARDFYQHYYSPHNACGVLVGDIDIATTREMLKRTFGRIPRRGDPPPVRTTEPPQMGERRVEVRFEAAPQLLMGYHKPASPDPDDTTAELLSSVLGDGRTSRLFRRLVLKDRIARSVNAGNGSPGERYDNLFIISAQPIKGHSTAECEAAIDEEIARVASEGVTEPELARARARLEMSVMHLLATNNGIARLLANSQLVTGDWHEPWRFLERIRSVTSADLQAFAAKYLVRRNRTVAVLVDTRAEAPAPVQP